MFFKVALCLFTLPFIIPRTVLLSSIQPEAETLYFSTHALPRNLKYSHHVNTNKGSVVKQSGSGVEGYRSQKVLFQPNVLVFLRYSVKGRKSVNSSYSIWISE